MQFSVKNKTLLRFSVSKTERMVNYYAFGSSITEMQYASNTAGKYRYGLNNQEKDDEVSGKGIVIRQNIGNMIVG